MSTVLLLHSILRYFILILLLVVIVKSLMGWQSKSEYKKLDDKLSLWLFICTHTQLLLGLILYFISPVVIFSGASMKEAVTRYWLVEHNTGMIIAIVLISVARISAKKITDSTAKHKRMFLLNLFALLVILAVLATMKGRSGFAIS